MKWDLTTLSSLYLVAISLTDSVRSLRDLNKGHLPMLHSIRKEATRIVMEKWGLGKGALRFYVHYQPSYCALTSFVSSDEKKPTDYGY
jgi:m7GpppX diphosphatase